MKYLKKNALKMQIMPLTSPEAMRATELGKEGQGFACRES